eukprot:1416825-Rhodomonas_salina.1
MMTGAVGGQWLTLDIPIASVRQQGPTCGLVALKMGHDWLKQQPSAPLAAYALARSDLLSSHSTWRSNRPPEHSSACSVEALLDAAIGEGFSRYGEMFSAADLAALARKTCELDVEVLHTPSAQSMCCQIAQGKPLLIAYDADKNDQPSMLGGSRAHWALICGVAIPPSSPSLQQLAAAAWSQGHALPAHLSVGGVHESNKPVILPTHKPTPQSRQPSAHTLSSDSEASQPPSSASGSPPHSSPSP